LSDTKRRSDIVPEAIVIARRLQTKPFELRAIMSLSRPCQCRSTYEDALRLLPEVYGWSTEGFDTPDLRDAQAFLIS